MAIFLSGPTGVGKSTVIQKVVAALHVTPGGFVTRSVYTDVGDMISVHMCGADGYDPGAEVGLRLPDGTWRGNPAAFDGAGVSLLERRPQAPLLLMDELGFMEGEALVFQEKVLTCLAARTFVLGVMKPFSLPFLDAVRSVSGVREIAVNLRNREGLPQEIIAIIKKGWSCDDKNSC